MLLSMMMSPTNRLLTANGMASTSGKYKPSQIAVKEKLVGISS